MKDQKAILQQIQLIKKQIAELEQMVRYESSEFVIKAGFTHEVIAAGLVDRNGVFNQSIACSIGLQEYIGLSQEQKFRLYCKGIYNALKMIPVTELERYLKDDGPQIELHYHDIGPFEEVPEGCEELAEQMKLHLVAYRIKCIGMNKNDFLTLVGK